ncbi:MAG: hydroxyacylglutathione hydrolase [Lysobacter sp.]
MRLQALPAFNDNYIWLLHDDNGGALAIDPGEAAPVLAAADSDGLRLTAILLTHHHPDHIGGAAHLQAHWPGVPVFAPEDPRIDCATTRVADGQRVAAGGCEFDVIGVPGHTTSHVAFHLDDGDESVLFCGDTLFSLGCGRLFEGSAGQMYGSLSRLAALPGHTRVCCGHEYTLSNAAFARVVEPDNLALRRRTEEAQAMRDAALPTLPSTIADERGCNPFLRCDQPTVIAAVERRLGHRPADAIEVFAELRRWKDGFVA